MTAPQGAPRLRTSLALLAASLGLVVGAACGTGDDDTFQRIDSEELFGLDQATTTSTMTTTTTTVPESSVPSPTTTTAASSSTIPTEAIELYFLAGNQLERVYSSLSQGASEIRVMTLLEDGPPAEAGVGLRSFVPQGLITSVRPSGRGFAEVDLAEVPFERIDQRDQRLAIAQIVLTLTRRPGVGQVQFTLDGEPLAVPGQDNVQTEPGGPVSRQDYESLLVDPEPEDTQPEPEPTDPPDPTVDPTTEPTPPT
ncbi:hypothetical protein BH18ACT2_BH18ACT2_20070 [soil metagenome]